MKLNSFKDLFVSLLSDIYVVEVQLTVDLPLLIKKATSEHLKEGLRTHLAETKEQVKRLERVFNLMNEEPKRLDWGYDFRNLAKDLDKFLRENPPSAVLDAAIVVIAQRVEHFEIATYGTLVEFADVSDNDEIKTILKDSLKEEIKADAELTKLAKGRFFTAGINEEALHRF